MFTYLNLNQINRCDEPLPLKLHQFCCIMCNFIKNLASKLVSFSNHLGERHSSFALSSVSASNTRQPPLVSTEN